MQDAEEGCTGTCLVDPGSLAIPAGASVFPPSEPVTKQSWKLNLEGFGEGEGSEVTVCDQ